jgi:hypothetical protein
MRTIERRRERLIIGAGGVLLIGSLFLPWADFGGPSRSGWQLWTMADVYLLITGTVAIWAAISGGRFGLFRPDLSLNGATDLLGVVATLLITWLVAFDFPHGASREVGVFVALAAAVAVMGGAGDYGTLRGTSWFPPTPASGYFFSSSPPSSPPDDSDVLKGHATLAPDTRRAAEGADLTEPPEAGA